MGQSLLNFCKGNLKEGSIQRKTIKRIRLQKGARRCSWGLPNGMCCQEGGHGNCSNGEK